MPRTDRGLRRCYLHRQVVDGDCVWNDDKHNDVDVSPTRERLEYYPVNPYFRERQKEDIKSPRRQSDPISKARSPSPEVLKSSKRIRWSESGDSIRTYSPEVQRPRSVEHIEYYTPTPTKESTKRSTKKTTKTKKKRSKSDDNQTLKREQERRHLEQERQRKQEEERQRRLEQERRRRQEEERKKLEDDRRRKARLAAEDEERRRRQVEEVRRREEELKRSKQNQNVRRSSSNRAKTGKMKRSTSTGNLQPKKTTKNQKAKPSLTSEQRSSSLSDIHFQQAKGKTKKIQKPRWNYVGDPTRRSFNTKEQRFLSDFYF